MDRDRANRQARRRAELAAMLLPRLTVGDYLPRCRFLSEIMGISYVTAYQDMNDVLKKAGVSWKRVHWGVVVTGIETNTAKDRYHPS